MSSSEIKYLLAVSELGSCRVKDIAAKLGYSKASVCRAIDRLEYLRLVVRCKDKTIHLTDDGQKVSQQCDKCLNLIEKVLTDNLGCSTLKAKQDAVAVLAAVSEESFNSICDKASKNKEG